MSDKASQVFELHEEDSLFIGETHIKVKDRCQRWLAVSPPNSDARPRPAAPLTRVARQVCGECDCCVAPKEEFDGTTPGLITQGVPGAPWDPFARGPPGPSQDPV